MVQFEDIIDLINNIAKAILYWFQSIILFFVPNRFKRKDVSNDIILITGAGSGFGRELAIRFAKLGSKIVMWDIDQKGLNQSEEIIKGLGAECKTYICDITNRELVYKTAKQVKEEVGIVSILINNAGIVFGGKFLDITDEQVIKSFNVNTFSHYWMIRAFLPDMKSQKKGHIVSVASVAALGGSMSLAAYCATKAAALSLMESLLVESYFDGFKELKLTCICPFFMNTGMFEGVESKFLSILDPGKTADKAVESILIEKELVFIPRFVYFLYPFKAFLPPKSMISLLAGLKADRFMDNFVGRMSNNNNTTNKNISSDNRITVQYNFT